MRQGGDVAFAVLDALGARGYEAENEVVPWRGPDPGALGLMTGADCPQRVSSSGPPTRPSKASTSSEAEYVNPNRGSCRRGPITIASSIPLTPKTIRR